MFYTDIASTTPGFLLELKGKNTERAVLFEQVYSALSEKHVLAEKGYYRLEELERAMMGQRSLPEGSWDDYNLHLEEFDLIRKEPDRTKLPDKIKKRMMNTTICPRVLEGRINLLLISQGKAPLVGAGGDKDDRNLPLKWLLFCARVMDLENLTGAFWAPIRHTDSFGLYLNKMSWIMGHASEVLKNELGFHAGNPKNYNDIVMLTNIGRVKVKSQHQADKYYMPADALENLKNVRLEAFATKLEEAITNHWNRYLLHCNEKHRQPLDDNAYFLKMTQLLKITCEYSPCDMPLPVARIKLLREYSIPLGADMLEQYVHMLGTFLTYGLLTPAQLKKHGQSDELITWAQHSEQEITTRVGLVKATFISKKLRDERRSFLRLVDRQYELTPIIPPEMPEQQAEIQEEEENQVAERRPMRG